MKDPADWRLGDDWIFPVEDCLGNSEGMLPLPVIVGMPTRSANG